MIKIISRLLSIALFFHCANVCAAPHLTFVEFSQVGGPPPTDVKVSFRIADLDNGSYARLTGLLDDPKETLWLTISGYEDDFPPPFGSGDDLLGSFMVMLTEADVTGLSGGGYQGRTIFMHTFIGGIAAGGGISDNAYFLQLDSVKVHVVAEPSTLLLILLIGMGVFGLLVVRRSRTIHDFAKA